MLTHLTNNTSQDVNLIPNTSLQLSITKYQAQCQFSNSIQQRPIRFTMSVSSIPFNPKFRRRLIFSVIRNPSNQTDLFNYQCLGISASVPPMARRFTIDFRMFIQNRFQSNGGSWWWSRWKTRRDSNLLTIARNFCYRYWVSDDDEDRSTFSPRRLV